MVDLSADQRLFLERIAKGERPLLADRKQDRVRQSCRHMGLCEFKGRPVKWALTDLGRSSLTPDKEGA